MHKLLIISTLLGVTMTATAAQSCNNTITPTTPTSRFVINGDGTVTDSTTHLVWQQCLQGQTGSTCVGTQATYTWNLALQRAETVNATGGFAGYTDWRVPNIKELRSIVEEQCTDPAINLAVFPNDSGSSVWSGSPSNYGAGDAWDVYFNNGSTNPNYSYRHSNGALRLVRGGQ